MTRTITIGVFLGLFSVAAFSQSKPIDDKPFKTVELFSPWIKNGTKVAHDPQRARRSCLDLVLLKQTNCHDGETLRYGNRIGEHWDIFALEAKESRMIDLGKQKWTDNFRIPEIEPWTKLKPGERRTIAINVSGADGRHGTDGKPGEPGRNADGTFAAGPPSTVKTARRKPVPKEGFANAPLNRQVTSTITVSGKSTRPDIYNPLTEVELAHMYLVRVVDSRNDHYVLIRVEELARGEKVVISYFKFATLIL